MKILLFGATGMIGQGVLRKCFLDPSVQSVVAIGRSATGITHPKLRDLIHSDLSRYDSIEPSLAGFDACFFCLGVTSAGMTEADYERITYGLTLAAAETLVRFNPHMVFVYISGAGADTSERGRVMWARLKGKTENALLRLPFRAAYMFRPGVIQPLHGIQSKTPSYRVLYAFAKPLLPALRRLFPNSILSTQDIGRAMLLVAQRGAPKPILETRDIRALLTTN
jgi:uncharacterized protein YbjT (DUF2867 family)